MHACNYTYVATVCAIHVVYLCYRSEQQSALSSAANDNISGARPVFDSLDWTEESIRMFETIGQRGEQYQICSAPATRVSSYNCTHVYCITSIIQVFIMI